MCQMNLIQQNRTLLSISPGYRMTNSMTTTAETAIRRCEQYSFVVQASRFPNIFDGNSTAKAKSLCKSPGKTV
jgi:hypothetical protein